MSDSVSGGVATSGRASGWWCPAVLTMRSTGGSPRRTTCRTHDAHMFSFVPAGRIPPSGWWCTCCQFFPTLNRSSQSPKRDMQHRSHCHTHGLNCRSKRFGGIGRSSSGTRPGRRRRPSQLSLVCITTQPATSSSSPTSRFALGASSLPSRRNGLRRCTSPARPRPKSVTTTGSTPARSSGS